MNNIERAKNCLKYLEGIKPQLYHRGVSVENAIPKNAMLFIGINPSYDEDKKDNVEGYDLCNDPKLMVSYFRKAIDISNKNQLPFGHHDIFQVRETNQKVVESMFNDVLSADVRLLVPNDSYLEFVQESIKFLEESVHSCNPRIIVVSNAFATRLFFDCYTNGKKGLLGFVPGKDWDDKLGVDFVTINDSRVPILFSGMLSGQRALDMGSEFRLRWHISHILKNL